MLKVEVESTLFSEKSGTAKKTGKPYTIREQGAWLHTVDDHGKPSKYPQKFNVMIEDAPYQPGQYLLHPSCIGVGEYGRLIITRAKLVPVSAPAASK